MGLQHTNTTTRVPAAWCSTNSTKASVGNQQSAHASMFGMPQQGALPATLGQRNCHSSMPVVIATQRASAPIPPPLARLGEAPYVWEPASFPAASSTTAFPSLPQQSISRLSMPPLEPAKQLMHPGEARTPTKLSSQLSNNGLNYSAQQQAQSRLRTLLLFANEGHTPVNHRSNSNCAADAKLAGQQQLSVLGRPHGPGPMMQPPQVGSYAAISTSSCADFTTMAVQPQNPTGPAPALDIQGMRSIAATVQMNPQAWVQESQANEGPEPMDWEACAPYPVMFVGMRQGQCGPVANFTVTAARVKSPERVSVMTLTSPAPLTGTAQPPHQVDEHGARLQVASKKTGYVKKQATWLYDNRMQRKHNYNDVLQHIKNMHTKLETEVVMVRQQLEAARQLEQQQLQSPMQVATRIEMQYEKLHEDLLQAQDLLQQCEEKGWPAQMFMGAVTSRPAKADTEENARGPQGPALCSSVIGTPDGHIADVIDSPAAKAALPVSNKAIAAGAQEGKAPVSTPVKKAAARKQLATPSIRSKLAAARQQQSRAATSTPTKSAVTSAQLAGGDINSTLAVSTTSTASTTQSGNSSAAAGGNSTPPATPPARRGLNLKFGSNKDSLSSRQHSGLASVFDAPPNSNATSAQQRPMQPVGQRTPGKLSIRLSPQSLAFANQLAATASGTSPSSSPIGSLATQVTASRNALDALLAYDDEQLQVDTRDQVSGSKPAAQISATKGPACRARKSQTPSKSALE